MKFTSLLLPFLCIAVSAQHTFLRANEDDARKLQTTGTPRPTRTPTTPRPTRAPTTPRPTRTPTTPRPTQIPTSMPTFKPTVSTASPSTSHMPSSGLSCDDTCSTLTSQVACDAETSCRHCIWVRDACRVEIKWHGYTEIGQTHVVRAVGETRHAPKVIAEREAELLFFPTLDAQPTMTPTSAPSETVIHQFGLEKVGNFTVDLVNAGDTWGTGYPSDKLKLLNPGTEYYIPAAIKDLDFNFDLLSQRLIQGVYVQIWFYSSVESIRIGLHSDDGRDDTTAGSPLPTSGWTWFEGGAASTVNQEVVITIPKTAARYVRISLRGGSRGSSTWGLRQIQISGSLDGQIVEPITNDETTAADSVGFMPSQTAHVQLDAFGSSGESLGTMAVRNLGSQRSLLEQSLVTSSTTLDSYSSIDMWSVTVPWYWVKEGYQLRLSVNHTNGKILTHTLTLHNLAQWGEHTLIRNKVVIFGNASDVAGLDSFTHAASKLAIGMFSAMPLAALNWVDAALWHLPYLVVATKAGPKLVRSEGERRQAFIDAGQTGYGTEPEWAVLKNQLALRHSMANTGRGFAVTTDAGDSSPYASHTSIFMGWALTSMQSDGSMNWKSLGYWSGWSAAAWTGWCAMKPGDECGNTLIHEIGHSQTMGHFTSGSAANWGIADEYPYDGVNTEFHPWGFDTVTRRFRTWYNHVDGGGKRDPMNDGEAPNSETCFPQYTAYHAKKSQNWAKSSPVLLSAQTAGVPSDGAYLFNEATHNYDKINDNHVNSVIGSGAMPPIQVGVPVLTMIGTLGQRDETCQTYPELRASAGNTFQFPSPLDGSLTSSIYNGASYMVEVTFQNGSSRQGLIAVPNLGSSTALRFFSFTIAISDSPIKVDVYRYNVDSYPNILSSSTKTLLHTRFISISGNEMDGSIAATTRVGRGWLGSSGDVDITSVCTSETECETNSVILKWRGESGNIRYASVVPSSNRNSTSELKIAATRLEDGTPYTFTVLASRFVNEKSAPFLLSDPAAAAAAAVPMIEDAPTHGIKFWVPYDLNPQLASGTYKFIGTVAQATNPDGSLFATFRINLNVYLPKATETVNLLMMSGTSYYKSPTYTALASSAYFVVTDPSIGPTVGVWWGGSLSTLTVPLVSFGCNNQVVTATIQGRQQTTCSTTQWQMNAGRGADDCGNFLLLTLAAPSSASSSNSSSTVINPWMVDSSLKGCKFETHPSKPIQIKAHRWHAPNAGLLLGQMILKMEAQL